MIKAFLLPLLFFTSLALGNETVPLFPRQDTLVETLFGGGTDTYSRGGISGGGAESVPTNTLTHYKVTQDGKTKEYPQSHWVLIDFWHYDHSYVDATLYDTGGVCNEQSKLIDPDCFQHPRHKKEEPFLRYLLDGRILDITKEIPTTNEFIQKKLELWRSDSPILVEMLRKSISDTVWRVSPFPFSCKGRGSPAPDSHLNFPNIVVNEGAKSVACFNLEFGTFINTEIWNLMGLQSRAGTIIHESLRRIQTLSDLSFSDRRLIQAVYNMVLGQPDMKDKGKLDRLILEDQWYPHEEPQRNEKRYCKNKDELDKYQYDCLTPSEVNHVDFSTDLICMEEHGLQLAEPNQFDLGCGELLGYSTQSSFQEPQLYQTLHNPHRLEAIMKMFEKVIAKTPYTTKPSVSLNTICDALTSRKIFESQKTCRHMDKWTVDHYKGVLDAGLTALQFKSSYPESFSKAVNNTSWLRYWKSYLSIGFSRETLTTRLNEFKTLYYGNDVRKGVCYDVFSFLWNGTLTKSVKGNSVFLKNYRYLNTYLHYYIKVIENNSSILQNYNLSTTFNSFHWQIVDQVFAQHFEPYACEYMKLWQYKKRNYYLSTKTDSDKRFYNSIKKYIGTEWMTKKIEDPFYYIKP